MEISFKVVYLLSETKKNTMALTIKQEMDKKRKFLKDKLVQITFPDTKETILCWKIASELGISGTTVKNYTLDTGVLPDGYMGEAILKTYEKLKKDGEWA